jgi:hypothetical protein
MIILKSGYNTDGALVYWLRLARRTKVLLGCLRQPGQFRIDFSKNDLF